jgi:hypothetical protein
MASGLITKNTDLKSLKYGSMPLGSDKPYVTKNIGDAPSSQIGSEISHRIDDVSRIAQMLVGRPGIKYLLHEAQLQQIGVGQRIKKAQQGGKSLVGAVLQQVGSTLLNTVKIAGSTLAQVPVNGTGTHFLKGFRTDTYLKPGANEKTPGAFASFFGAGGVEGAPYALRGEEVPTNIKSDFYDPDVDYTAPSPEVEPIESLNLSKTTNRYLPTATAEEAADGIILDAFLETGIDPLNRTYLEQKQQLTKIVETTKTPGTNGSISNNNPEDVKRTDKTDKFPLRGVSGQSEDWDETSPQVSTYITQKKNYLTKNTNITKESRVRLGDQGAKGTPDMQDARATNSYWFRSDKDAQTALETDKINALFPNDGKILGEGKTYQDQVLNGGQTLGRDLVKFRFHILTPDGKEKVLYFRAFVDSFADNYSGQWNPVKYLGRAEDFQIYSGFQRKISLSFKIAAASRAEMRPLYEKMIWLASATAPTYANDGQFMRGTITKITLGDYIYELPGVLNSVNYTWNTEYPWEIAMTQPEKLGMDDFEQELPMIMDCSIDFTPIHTFTPTTGLKQYITTKTSEAGRNGIPDIDNTKTGIEPTPAVASTAPTNTTPVPPLLAAPAFDPQLA